MKIKPKNFLGVLALTTLTISIIAVSMFMNRAGVSFDIREKAVYEPSPTYGPFPTIPPEIQADLYAQPNPCRIPVTSPSGTPCTFKLTWYMNGCPGSVTLWDLKNNPPNKISSSKSGSMYLNLRKGKLEIRTFHLRCTVSGNDIVTYALGVALEQY